MQDGAAQAEESRLDAEPDLNRVFTVLQTATGIDFRQYKPNTIQRRLHRRMALRGVQTVKEYVLDLQRHPAEVRALHQDLLITVTAFFRDPDALAALRHPVLPQLLAQRSPDDPLRVWVAGCATGEEAYSLAMCLTEFVEEAAIPVRIQVFATDLSEPAIDKARAGLYLGKCPGRRVAGTATALLRQDGRALPDQQSTPRAVCLRQARRGRGPAVLQGGSDHLL